MAARWCPPTGAGGMFCGMGQWPQCRLPSGAAPRGPAMRSQEDDAPSTARTARARGRRQLPSAGRKSLRGTLARPLARYSQWLDRVPGAEAPMKGRMPPAATPWRHRRSPTTRRGLPPQDAAWGHLPRRGLGTGQAFCVALYARPLSDWEPVAWWLRHRYQRSRGGPPPRRATGGARRRADRGGDDAERGERALLATELHPYHGRFLRELLAPLDAPAPGAIIPPLLVAIDEAVAPGAAGHD